MRRIDDSPRRQDGQLLLVVLILLALAMVLTMTGLDTVTNRDIQTRVARNRLVAELAAQSGVQRQVARIEQARHLAGAGSPFATIDALDTNASTGAGGYTVALADEPLLDTDGDSVAEYDVFVDILSGGANARRVAITCYAYVPDKASYSAGVSDAVRADAHTVAEVTRRGSEVFDYAYFINHWGWFYGDSIVTHGNVRSNGQFDFGGYASTIHGAPRYAGSDGTSLLGYLDDNGDGITDGSDGGVYSGFGVVNAQNVRGMGGESQNQHDDQPMIEMPNLSDLSFYEERAVADGASIRVGGATHVAGVLGDDAGEKEHLFLVGTQTDPIVLDGPVVVRGSVVISGWVTGQGSIYAGGNIYVADDVRYVNGPSTSFPSATDQATVEAWRADAATKDSLGLFAREHVVVGDYTHSWWQSNVSSWIDHPLNESTEDAGVDGIQNTRAGADGVLGTADDDVLEGDGEWTVSRYTQEDADKGLVPPGKSVGDVIPGSGEDIDGDGLRDGRTRMTEFELPAALSPSLWAGNMTQSYARYSDIASIQIARIDAALYTNHTLAALMINWGADIEVNGSIVSRNEAIIYGANSIVMNHDERLSGRGSAASGFQSAVGWDPIDLIHWEFDKPLPAGVSGDPETIESHWTGSNPS